MKQRSCTTQQDLDKAADAIRLLGEHLPVVVSVTQGKRIRSTIANARYWAGLTDALHRIDEDVQAMSDRTGYTNLEARRIIAEKLPWEKSMILMARKPEVAHEIMKMIAGIPTSIRLGSKEFMKFEETMEREISEIVGAIRAIAMKVP